MYELHTLYCSKQGKLNLWTVRPVYIQCSKINYSPKYALYAIIIKNINLSKFFYWLQNVSLTCFSNDKHFCLPNEKLIHNKHNRNPNKVLTLQNIHCRQWLIMRAIKFHIMCICNRKFLKNQNTLKSISRYMYYTKKLFQFC